MNKHISALLVLCLCMIASIVAIGLILKQNMWLFIITYWIVLTIKNVVDFIGGKKYGK